MDDKEKNYNIWNDCLICGKSLKSYSPYYIGCTKDIYGIATNPDKQIEWERIPIYLNDKVKAVLIRNNPTYYEIISEINSNPEFETLFSIKEKALTVDQAKKRLAFI